MKLYILANPHAGHKQAHKVLASIADLYPNLELVPYFTRGMDDEVNQVNKILNQLDLQEDRLLILGGDGTLSKTLACLPPSYPFAYYPTGSGNDFARSLGIWDLNSVLHALLIGSSRPLTIVQSSLGTVVNSLDMGYAAQVIAYSENSKLKSFLNTVKMGKLTYLCFGLLSLFSPSLPPVRMWIDGQEQVVEQLFFLSCANNTYFGGGIMIWPESSAYTSQIDLVWFSRGNFWSRVRALVAMLLGRHHHSPFLYHQTCSQLVLATEETVALQIDGELVHTKEVRLSCQERRIYL